MTSAGEPGDKGDVVGFQNIYRFINVYQTVVFAQTANSYIYDGGAYRLVLVTKRDQTQWVGFVRINRLVRTQWGNSY